MFGTKPHFLEDLLQMVLPASRCAPQAHKDFSVSFQITVPLLGSSVYSRHSGGGSARTTSPSFMCALRKAVFTSAVNIV